MATSPGTMLDPALPALERALDSVAMQEILDRATHPRSARGHHATILSHKVGQRCTIRYTPVGDSSAESRGGLIGKLYRSRRRARRMYDRQIELGALAFSDAGRTRLPAALSFIEELGLVLQSGIDGIDLRDFIETDASVAPFELAGTWLARLHGCDPPEGLRFVPTGGRLARLEGWFDEIRSHLSAEDERGLARALDAASSRMASVGSPVVIHKDFYYANLLWDGAAIWGLDLDEVGVGDAALDVGHFLAHLERHAWRTGRGVSAAHESSRRFLMTYEEIMGQGARTLTPFYKAYTFVKLAATEVVRRREDWRTATRQLAEFGRRELETYDPAQTSDSRPSM